MAQKDVKLVIANKLYERVSALPVRPMLRNGRYGVFDCR
jgi:hypothetical protein